VHFMRNLLSTVPKQTQDAVGAIVRMIFIEPDHASAMAKLHEVSRMLFESCPQAAELLEDASEDVLAHMHFPREHPRRLHSTHPLERLHKEIKRRTRVVGIFPNRDSLMRMVGTATRRAGRRVAGDGSALLQSRVDDEGRRPRRG
jgi:putative transposase